MAAELVTSVDYYRQRARRKSTVGLSVLLGGSALIGLLAVAFPPGWLAFFAAAAVGIVVLTWYRPLIGVAVLLGFTLLFEEFQFADNIRIVTAEVPFFQRLSNFTPVSAPISVFELLLLLVVAVVVLKVLMRREVWRPSPFSAALGVFAAALVLWVIWGLVSGGAANIVYWEFRGFVPFILLGIAVPQIIHDERDVRLLLWIAVVAVILKAFQGLYTYNYLLHRSTSTVRSITAHEDAVFIGWMVVLMAAALAYGQFRGQSRAILAALPFMGATFVLTDRRAVYIALLLGMLLLSVLLFTDRTKRRLLARAGLPIALLCLALIGGGWNASGPIAAPAQAIKSVFMPTDLLDAQSNLYRKIEENQLIASIGSSPIFGLGFGRRFVPPGVLMVKLSYTLSEYIPHNEIFWVWSKMGTVGFALFWAVFGSFIVYGIMLFRKSTRPEVKVLAAFVAIAITMQLVVSYADLQLTFVRNMTFLGVLVGILARLESLYPEESTHADA